MPPRFRDRAREVVATIGTISRLTARRVFVVGAFVGHGGTWMAYHIGRVLQQSFGFEPWAVTVGKELEQEPMFPYPERYPAIAIGDVPSEVKDEDFLVVNPSFSRHLLGFRAPGTKVSYVQHFNSFAVLDGAFDLYVSVSRHVAEFLRETYRLETSVVPPFVVQRAEGALSLPSWREKLDRVLVLSKGGEYAAECLRRLQALYPECFGEYIHRIDWTPNHIGHAAMLDLMASYRYCLTLSPCEGFGLMPLEAMMAGCCVMGFDGVGGRDYLVDGYNAAVTHYPDFDGLAARMQKVLENDRYASALAANGPFTAEQFSETKFRQRWKSLLAPLIQRRTS